MVLIRNLLFAPARGHFNQPIAPIVSALVLPRFASLSNSSTAFLSSSGSSSSSSMAAALRPSRAPCPGLNQAVSGRSGAEAGAEDPGGEGGAGAVRAGAAATATATPRRGPPAAAGGLRLLLRLTSAPPSPPRECSEQKRG